MREIGAAREETTAYWRREPKCTTDIGFDNVEVTWRGGRRDVVFLDTGNKRPPRPKISKGRSYPSSGAGSSGAGSSGAGSSGAGLWHAAQRLIAKIAPLAGNTLVKLHRT